MRIPAASARQVVYIALVLGLGGQKAYIEEGKNHGIEAIRSKSAIT